MSNVVLNGRHPTDAQKILPLQTTVDPSNPNKLFLAGSELVATVSANFSNPSSAGAYQAGDIIANSATAASVVPITFTLSRSSGRLSGCRCVVTPASGNLVITALDFDLLLFRPVTSVPFAAAGYPADNDPLTITAAAYRSFVGSFRFAAGAWRNPLGALTAGATGFQAVAPTGPTTIAFNVDGLSNTLVGVVQALGAWTPGAVINRFDFTLDAVTA